jgi:hypothetical protein
VSITEGRERRGEGGRHAIVTVRVIVRVQPLETCEYCIYLFIHFFVRSAVGCCESTSAAVSIIRFDNDHKQYVSYYGAS